jgi:hypothetical protein
MLVWPAEQMLQNIYRSAGKKPKDAAIHGQPASDELLTSASTTEEEIFEGYAASEDQSLYATWAYGIQRVIDKNESGEYMFNMPEALRSQLLEFDITGDGKTLNRLEIVFQKVIDKENEADTLEESKEAAKMRKAYGFKSIDFGGGDQKKMETFKKNETSGKQPSKPSWKSLNVKMHTCYHPKPKVCLLQYQLQESIWKNFS